MSAENSIYDGKILYIKAYSLPVTETTKYAGYPIFYKYKVTNAKYAKIENPDSGGFQRMGNEEYWKPFPGYAHFYEYTAGDENVTQVFSLRNTAVTDKDPANITSRLNSPTSVGTARFTNSEVGATKIFQGEIYKATTQFVKWEDISKYDTIPVPALRMSSSNPYLTANIRVWVKVSGSNLSEDTGFVYWFNPTTETFYVVNPNIIFATNVSNESVQGETVQQRIVRESIREGRVLALIVQGKTREQAIEQISNSAAGSGPGKKAPLAVGGGGTSSTTGTASSSIIRATVRVRGNFGYVEPGEIEGGGAQMVQYYKSGDSQAPLTARHIFTPKPNQINYQNIGSEWTEIERSGRIPLVDWKNYKLMRVSFQFLVIPDEAYRLGAFGETANDGITLSIDSKLEVLRNIAARPYPVILYGFDELLANANPFSMSTGAGVQFAITDFSITSMMRTPTGNINRAQCDITLQEVPIEYINIISLPKLIPGQTIKPKSPDIGEPEYGQRLLATDSANEVNEIRGYVPSTQVEE